MSVAGVSLEDFRNYAHLSVGLAPGLNVVHGPNAQGKTNFLEALYLLSTARLLRGFRDAEAVRTGAQRAIVRGELEPGGSRIEVVLQAGIRKRVAINGMALPRASDLLGRLPCVCVSSADLPLVSGEPSDRRLFLDLELSALYPSYLRSLTYYKRALEQRNALLKAAQEQTMPDELFEPWEEQLAHHGAAMRKARRDFVEDLAPTASETQCHLGNGETLSVSYAPKDDAFDEDLLREALVRSRRQEIARGSTNVGPHRDDLAIDVDGKEARLYGSQGQQRSAMISIKLATLRHTRTLLGEPALLLLDDVFSDLDVSRRAHLVDWVLSHAGQAVLTCTEAESAGKELLSRSRIFQCRSGNLDES